MAQLFATTATCNASSPQRLIGSLARWLTAWLMCSWVQHYFFVAFFLFRVSRGACKCIIFTFPKLRCCRISASFGIALRLADHTALLTSDFVITIKRTTHTNYLLLFICFLLICNAKIIEPLKFGKYARHI